jgi:single-strand DNA-binding protein
MANLNKVMLIGRLTRDPEIRAFANGGKVAKIGFAVNNRKKNQSTGQWEDEPVYVDIDAFNREPGRKMADLVEQYFKKGSQFYIEGRLVLDQWTDKDGQKRSKLKLVMDDFQFLDAKQDASGGMNEGGMARAQRPAVSAPKTAAPSYSGGGYEEEPEMDGPPPRGNGSQPEEDIPF